MNKKAQGLPLTTIIIAILVVVVLIVIVAFFLGSSSGLVKSIKGIFFKTTAGTDMTIAVESCKQYCEQAKGLSASLRGSSAYCTQTFNIDRDNNGEADRVGDKPDGKLIKWQCNLITEIEDTKSLNVPCADENGKDITCGGQGQTQAPPSN